MRRAPAAARPIERLMDLRKTAADDDHFPLGWLQWEDSRQKLDEQIAAECCAMPNLSNLHPPYLSGLATSARPKLEDIPLVDLRALYAGHAQIDTAPSFDLTSIALEAPVIDTPLEGDAEPGVEFALGAPLDGVTSARLAQENQMHKRPLKLSKQGSALSQLIDLHLMLPFQSPDSEVQYTFSPDGSVSTTQKAPDGRTLVETTFPEGSRREKLCDRYGRPLFVCDVTSTGEWVLTELQYRGTMSPFVSRKIRTTAHSTTDELIPG